MDKVTLKDIDLKNKTVIVRVDFNVPQDADLKITDDTRIRATLPTIKHILQNGAKKIILMSHLGRPDGKVVRKYSLGPVANRLRELLGEPVKFLNDCIGDNIKREIKASEERVILLENLRFHPEEEANDPDFARELALLADIFVNDAFGTAHRSHASTEGVTHYLKAVAGLLLEKEIKFLGKAISNPEQPFIVILGGAKVSDKIGVIENLLPKCDYFIIAGGMAYTFLKAQGKEIGNSKLEKDKIDLAKSILEKAKALKKEILLPIDNIVVSEISPEAKTEIVGEDIPKGKIAVDIGPKTIDLFEDKLRPAKTIVWNGPLGIFEMDTFSKGTQQIAEFIANLNSTTIIGGGDTAAAIAKFKLEGRMTHISTGGGASLEFLEGKTLPGVAALTDKGRSAKDNAGLSKGAASPVENINKDSGIGWILGLLWQEINAFKTHLLGRFHQARAPNRTAKGRIFNRVIIVLLSLSMSINSGCANFFLAREAKRLISTAEQKLIQKDYESAFINYLMAYEFHPESIESIKTPVHLSQEARKALVDNYIAFYSGIENQVYLKPQGILLKLGITEEELRQGYLRALKNDEKNYDFGVAFHAARALAMLGEPLAKDILLAGLKGGYKAINAFAHSGQGELENEINYSNLPVYVSAGIPAQVLQKYISMLAAFSLAELGEPAAIERLISILSDSENCDYDWQMRANAAYSLGQFQDARIIEPLMKSAFDSDEQVRVASIWALGNIGEPKTFNLFTAALKDKNLDIVNEAITALGKLADPQAVPYLADTLTQASDNKETKLRIVFALGQIGNADTLPILIKLARDSNSEVRGTAISVLARFDEPEPKQVLIAALNDKEASVRSDAVMALSGRINEDPKIVDSIVALLRREKDDAVRVAMVNGLGGIPRPEVKKIIAGYLKDSKPRMRQTAALSLAAYSDKDTIDQIAPLLNDSKEEVKQVAILIVADKLKDNPQMFNQLYQRLNDPSHLIFSTTAIALSRYIDDYPQLEEPLRRLLREGDLNTRKGVLSGLAQTNSLTALDIIKPYLKDAETSIRQTAVLTLGQTGRPEAVSLLVPMLKDEHPFVRQAIAEAFVNVPGAALMELKPLLFDTSWQVRLKAAQILSNNIATEQKLVAPFMKLAKDDPHILVRSMATRGLAGVNQPDVTGVIEQNLRSNNWVLRQAATLAAGRIDSPALAPSLTAALKDEHHLVRSAAVGGLTDRIKQSPQIVDAIKPLLNDRFWQVRQVAVDALGASPRPDIEQSVVTALKDFSAAVRQSAVTNLGLRVNSNPQLFSHLVDRLKQDSNPWIRQLAAFSLKSVQAPQIESVKHLIQQTIPEIKTVVIIPGVDDPFLGINPISKRDLSVDSTKNWPLRMALEAGGVKVIEHRWTGNLIGRDFREAQLSLDKTVNSALDLAKGGRIGVIPYSGGNYVAERLLEPGLHVNIKEAFRANKIHIISLGNPSTKNFGLLDPNWRNIWSQSDWISKISAKSTPDIYEVQFRNLSHFAYQDPRVISYIGYNMFGWKYTPTQGLWPGRYNFSSVAPPDYYLRQQQLVPPSIIVPQLDYGASRIREPFVPRLPSIQYQPSTQMPGSVYTPAPIYRPEHGYWPGTYNFNIRAPDNYFRYQQQFIAPQTPILPPTPIIPHLGGSIRRR